MNFESLVESRTRRVNQPLALQEEKCDHFGIPSTSHWTGAAIIVQ
jgi:hypothetical protein